MILLLASIFGLIHLAYTVYLAMAFKKTTPTLTSSTPSLSIIIAAKNEKDHLMHLIPKLLSQAYPDFEIIVALDRCNDGSADYLNEVPSKKLGVVEIHSTPEPWNGKKFALSKAIDAASGQWLVLTDADCIPSSDRWLESISQHTQEGTDIVLGISPYYSNASFLGKYSSFEALMTSFQYAGHALRGNPYMGVGRNLIIRASYFHETGGYGAFKEIQGGDDDLYIQRNATDANTQVMLGQDSLVYTYPKKTWRAYLQQKTRHLAVGSHYKPVHQWMLGLYHTTHLGIYLLLSFASMNAFFWSVLLFYLFIKLVSYRFAASQMGVRFNYLVLPFVDMLYALLTPMIGLGSKFVKDIKWKN